ncbi:glycosyltransferase family 2 protein [Sphingomonas crocodyli]|uniref:glycosyltransferase family 2 protein n=1 Tax=Sphingomonas crocodyli TaxID=1979270 RepID=UPI0013E2D394|nr:glycosyltransferase [Sphingomonas crocodyli]
MTSSLDAPKISCLIPVYNGETFLAEAIDSILSQSFRDFELIIVNDGSTDGTAAILEKYAGRDDRVKILTQPNGGIVAALNAGLSVCRGQYVARMDADDIAQPDRFEFQASYLDTHPGCVLVGGLASSIRPDGSRGGISSGGRHKRTDLGIFPPRIAVSLHPLITVRREALRSIGGYSDKFPHAEDYDLFIRLAPFGSVDNPDKIVLIYRRHEGAISIRHLELQERSAALAEIDARRAAGLPEISSETLEAYIRLRIWRRYQGVDWQKALDLRGQQIKDLFNLSPRLWASKPHWRLRLITLAAMARFVKTGLGRRARG